MTLVTDKEFFMEKNMIDLLDFCSERERVKWDNMFIIDGMEGVGKSELGRQIGYYYAHKNGKTFTADNVFMDIDNMLDYALKTRNQIIIWDEAAFGGLSIQWRLKVQQRLNVILMTTRKYNHFWIFICPSFFKLNDYQAIHRSIALINVYTPDLLERGNYALYNRNQKSYIYNHNKKSMIYGKRMSFVGRYGDVPGLIDMDVYERNKDIAIKKYAAETRDEDKMKLVYLQWRLATMLPTNKVVEITGAAHRTVTDWRKYGDRYNFSGGREVSSNVSREEEVSENE